MDAQSVSRLIASDLSANPGFFNSHGVDVQASLVAPELLKFENGHRQGELLTLWLVLKECPTEQTGYLVVYDETANKFGLAVYGKERPVFIGYHGSFTETLSGM